MKRPSCKDCLHCKVKTDPSLARNSPETALVTYCDKDAWPAKGHTETYNRFFGTSGNALALQFADGCLHYDDMAG